MSAVPKATAPSDVSISHVTNTADDVKPAKSIIKAHSSSEHDINRADDFKTDTYAGEFRHKLGVLQSNQTVHLKVENKVVHCTLEYAFSVHR